MTGGKVAIGTACASGSAAGAARRPEAGWLRVAIPSSSGKGEALRKTGKARQR